ncbi:2,3-dehydroadipyl-CoA hydratase, partial [Proteus mirabilis]
MQTDWILSHTAHRVLTLTLNRPEVRNALSTDCLELLVEHLEHADRDP